MVKDKMDIEVIKSQIQFQDWTNEELNELAMAIKYNRERLSKRTVWQMRIGAKVKFVSGRTGRTHYGEVVKINRKRVIVRENFTNWTVPANMLMEA